MFDGSWIDELSAAEAADELARVRDLVMMAEATQFALAAHWTDLHAPELVEDTRRSLPGMPWLVPSGPEGCPEIDEYAGAELAALLGRSTTAGEQLIRDAVTVRHRHPLLWTGIREGRVPVWLARQVARRCARAALPAGAARWVDEQTTPYATTLPPKRFLDLVDARIIEADPGAAQERARARALARFVRAGRTDEDGLRTLVARAAAGDVTYVVAVLDRLAGILVEKGDPRPVEVLRVEALRILANPARALALLTGAELEEADPDVEAAEELHERALFPGGAAGWMLDASGASLPGAPCVDDLTERPVDEEDVARLTAVGATPGAAAGAAASSPGGVDSGADPALLQALTNALAGFDQRRLEPLIVLHVHLSDAALTSREGVARVEELGPVVLSEVRDWLMQPYSPDRVCPRIQLRPVLDAATVRPVERYEWPAAMSEVATLRTPFEVFPWGTLSSRNADDDHVEPFVEPARGGPPGQTSLDNNARLSRFHHRLKTNGGWTLRRPEAGVYLWRTPHGHWFRLDGAGTHHLGRAPDLDERWLQQPRGRPELRLRPVSAGSRAPTPGATARRCRQ